MRFATSLFRFAALSSFAIALTFADNPQLLGVWPERLRGEVLDTFKSGNLIYAGGSAGLTIIDATHPANLTELGGLATSNTVVSVRVVGSYAYLGATESGLLVVNVSDPRNPRLVGGYNTPGSAQGMVVTNNRVYLADFELGMHIFDIATPTNPKFLGTYDPLIGRARDVAISGSNAFIASQNGGFQIVNVSNPAAPTLVKDMNTTSAANISIAGSLAYMTTVGGSFAVYNISNPSNPQSVGFTSVSGNPVDLAIANGHAYIAASAAGLHILSLANPSVPVKVGAHPTRDRAVGVHVVGNIAYVSNDEAGVEMVDVSNPAAPVPVSSYALGNAKDVVVRGNIAYLADGFAGLRVMNVATPTAPQLVRTIPNLNALAVVANGARAFLAAGAEGLKIFDIADPGNPQLLGTYDSPYTVTRVRVEGDVAYLATTARRWEIVDVIDPTKPTLMRERIAYSYQTDLLVAYGHVFTTDYGGVSAYDDNDRVVYIGVTDAQFVEARPKELLVGWENGLAMLSNAPPFYPVFGRGVASPGTLHPLPFGNYAYMTVGSAGVRVAGLGETPSIVGECDTRGFATRSAIANDNLYVADGVGGLVILAIPPALLPRPVELVAIAPADPGAPLRFQLTGSPGSSGRLQRALILGKWTDWQPVTFAADSVETIDPDVAINPAAFYRFISP